MQRNAGNAKSYFTIVSQMPDAASDAENDEFFNLAIKNSCDFGVRVTRVVTVLPSHRGPFRPTRLTPTEPLLSVKFGLILRGVY